MRRPFIERARRTLVRRDAPSNWTLVQRIMRVDARAHVVLPARCDEQSVVRLLVHLLQVPIAQFAGPGDGRGVDRFLVTRGLARFDAGWTWALTSIGSAGLAVGTPNCTGARGLKSIPVGRPCSPLRG